MTYRAVASSRFASQLDALERWLAERAGADTAVAVGEDILRRCAGLEHFPHRGTPHDDIRPGLRTIAHRGRFTIGYVVIGSTVTILGVIGRGQRLAELVGD